ncbi:MAG TPA: NUDIX hydrolase [Candidatus Moranbacteria bacterium]|nr:NUDIX hydrolase [Candidatus Moranbacteria bacterium]
MLYLEKPPEFEPDLEAVGCLVVCKKKILLLKRPEDDLYPNKWGIPSGKIEADEKPDDAIRRELEEETGIRTDNLDSLGKVYLIFPRLSFVYYVYRHDLDGRRIKIQLSKEHVKWKFVDPDKIEIFDIIADTDRCIELFYQ